MTGIMAMIAGMGGGGAPTISLSNATVSAYGTDTTAYSQYNLSSTGDIQAVTTGDSPGTVDIGDWISPKTNMGNYECLATVTSGTLTSGTTGTWLNLGTLRSWRVSRPLSNGTSTCQFTVAIRLVGTTTNLATATITLTVTTEDTGSVVMTL